MRLQENSSLALEDSPKVGETAAQFDKEMFGLLAFIILLLYTWWTILSP